MFYLHKQATTAHFCACINFSSCHNESFHSFGTHLSHALPHPCQYIFKFMPTCLEACFVDDIFLIFAEERVRRINIPLHLRLMQSIAKN